MEFKIAKREDFIAPYLGQTAIKTRKLLDSCVGGVLFIDEAYALGPGQQDKDSFSKEFLLVTSIPEMICNEEEVFCNSSNSVEVFRHTAHTCASFFRYSWNNRKKIY